MRTKYNVSANKDKRTYDDITFDSIMEMKFYKEYILPKYNCGEITNYELQKKYVLQDKFKREDITYRSIDYVADFYIEYSNGNSEVVDIKGMATPLAKLKKKMFLYRYKNLTYRWLTYSAIDGGFVDHDYVEKQRKIRRKNKEKDK